MMSVWQTATLAGGALGLGVALIVMRFLRADPELSGALDRLAGPPSDVVSERYIDDSTFSSRLGTRLYPRIRGMKWLKIPVTDLDLLRRSVPEFLGDKVLAAAVGLGLIPLLMAILALGGTTLPFTVPAFPSIALAAALFMVPDIGVRKSAVSAREEFGRALTSYIDLVALCRNNGIGTTQSLERAAVVADTWVFQRIAWELDQSVLSGESPWDALTKMSIRLDLPDLTTLADSMRMTGDHGASVYATLREQSKSMRNALLAKDQGEAGSATQKLSVPLALLTLVFLVMMTYPAVAGLAA
ncbi:hypothetical protein GS504_01210 [Rhodococcus hoagii]|nr:hypothetical protein [Prescottella equi]